MYFYFYQSVNTIDFLKNKLHSPGIKIYDEDINDKVITEEGTLNVQSDP